MRASSALCVLSLILSCFSKVILGRAVFAHYMVGTVTEDHAHQDIDDAIAMGLDGFALNVGNAYEPFVGEALGYLFGYAAYRGFKLYLSMDLYASGDACYKGGASCNNISDYTTILTDYLGSTAWYKGPNGQPMISTFSSGGCHNDTIQAWKQYFAFDMFFIPMLDETQGYYESAPEWWDYWGGVSDGIFSWESAWPAVHGTNDGDILLDQTVMNGALVHGKPYMMALSMLQYKDSYGTNLYRRGELNLPIRMKNILSMSPLPDFIQILTWNDGPEGHYIGNLWPEQNNDTQPGAYASQGGADHTGLQPLFTSFINAYKAGVGASSMSPGSNVPSAFSSYSPAVGAIWYKTIFQDTICASDGLGQYFNKPNGSDAGLDVVNWAVVLPSGVSGTVYIESSAQPIGTYSVTPGLNYGQASGISAGPQSLRFVNSFGTEYFTSTGRCIADGCPDDIYNYNPQVVGLDSISVPTEGCWQTAGTAVPVQDPSTGIWYATTGHSTEPTNGQSSCSVFEQISNISVDGVLDQSMWGLVDTENQFSSWMANYWATGENTWLLNLTNPLGVGLSSSTDRCTMVEACGSPPDCNAIDGGTEPSTAWQYAVMVSAFNFGDYMFKLHAIMLQVEAQFVDLKDTLDTTFWLSHDDGSDVSAQIINALIAGITVLGAVIDKPAAEAVGGVMNGILGGIALELNKADNALVDIASMEQFSYNYTQSIMDQLQDFNDDLLTSGRHTGKDPNGNSYQISITDILSGGNFIDSRTIPVLRPQKEYDIDSLSELGFNHLVAGLVNFVWKIQNVYIARFPMSQDDFDNNVANAGTDDFRLKYYYNGYGHYFQSSNLYSVAGTGYSLCENPPGWATVADSSQYGFSTWDIIKSSSDAFDMGGFNYTMSIDAITDAMTEIYSTGTLISANETTFAVPGVFTIPICQPPSNSLSVSDFFGILSAPDTHSGSAAFCSCWDNGDMNGVTIDQALDVYQIYESVCGTDVPPVQSD